MPNRVDAGMKSVLLLSWPAILSYILNNGYRINDQYWVQDLGPDAHAAIASSTFILILNFAVIFLPVGGCLPLVARATGARRPAERDDVIRHGLGLGLIIALFLGVLGWTATPWMTGLFRLEPATQVLAIRYLRMIYLGILPLVLAPIIDNIFIAMGNTKVPMAMQALAVACNLALNPILIYGIGSWNGMGIAGAALATCISRGITTLLGLLVMNRLFEVRFLGQGKLRPPRLIELIRLGLPTALSIANYAVVYMALFALVISDLGRDVEASLGIGFNVFESLSFPFFLGIALAGSSLVGRCLGASDPDEAWVAVRNVRLLGRLVGLAFALFFWFGGPIVAPWFSDDPGVLEETIRYVGILAWSQLLVAEQIINEKILYGAGHPRAIFWVSAPVDLSRIPLAWVFVFPLGLGAAGVWWVINITTYLKAGLFYWQVQRGRWVKPIGGEEEG